MPAGDPRIVGVRALPLLKNGEIANEAFWPTLIEVTTDVGVGGVGTVSNSLAQVESSIELLSELLIGETAQEPMRVTEKLHHNTFWQGRGGSVTHTISGIDIALSASPASPSPRPTCSGRCCGC